MCQLGFAKTGSQVGEVVEEEEEEEVVVVVVVVVVVGRFGEVGLSTCIWHLGGQSDA